MVEGIERNEMLWSSTGALLPPPQTVTWIKVFVFRKGGGNQISRNRYNSKTLSGGA
jgi:hypothetical protein